MIMAAKLTEISSCFLVLLSLIGSTWTLPIATQQQSAASSSVASLWWSVSVSTTGQYQTASLFGEDSPGIYTSSDYGTTWAIADISGYYPAFLAGWTSVSMSSDGQDQTAVDVQSGIYASSNYGATWTMALPLQEAWGSVSLSSYGDYQFAASQYGRVSVTNGGVITYSRDKGKTWRITGAPLAEWRSVSLASDGPNRTAVGFDGIYTADDESGNYWTRRSTPSTFAYDAWASVGLSSTGQYQTAVNAFGGICTSSDYGATWKITTAPSAVWASVSLSSTGEYQAAVAFDEDAGGIYTSSDSGATWTIALSLKLSWRSVSLSSTGQYQTAVAYGGGIYISSDYGAKWKTVRVSLMTPLPTMVRHGPSPLSLKLGGHMINGTAAEQLMFLKSQAVSFFEAQAESQGRARQVTSSG